MGWAMLYQTIKRIFRKFYAFIAPNSKELSESLGLQGSKTLCYSENGKLEVKKDTVGFILSSCDLFNTENGLEISQEIDENKTEMYDVVCTMNLNFEKGVLVLTKSIRRLTFYRNSKGRLVNMTFGPPKVIIEKVTSENN
jgi:hypothetical protein